MDASVGRDEDVANFNGIFGAKWRGKKSKEVDIEAVQHKPTL